MLAERHTAVLRKPLETLILNHTCLVLPIDIFINSDAKSPDVSKKLKDPVIKIRQIEDLSIEVPLLPNITDSGMTLMPSILLQQGVFSKP